MSQGFYTWSRTAGSNANADGSINYAEGQAPSSLNDSARAAMARLAEYRDDISGALVTTGTATAYAISSFEVFDTLAHLSGQMIAFVPHATNTNTVGVDVTLNVDGLGAKSIRAQPSVALPNGSLVLGTPYVVTYNNSDAVFYLQGGLSNPYNIPLGGVLPYTGTTAPNSSFAFPYGQAISRTTYASYFSLVGTTFGTGDGSTTFNILDVRGRVIAGKDDMGGSAANRLTTSYFGASSGQAGTTLGAVGGQESSTLQTANLPAYTPAGSISVGEQAVAPPGSAGGNLATSANGGSGNTALTATFNGTPQGGTSTPYTNVTPTIILNYLLRVI